MLLLGQLGPSKHEVSDLEDPSSNFSLVVPTKSLLVVSRADDSLVEPPRVGRLHLVEPPWLSRGLRPSLLGRRGQGQRAALLQLRRLGRKV